MSATKSIQKSSSKVSAGADELMSTVADNTDRVVLTLGDVYKAALKHYEQICPERKALPTVAGIIGISEKKLYRATVNEATLDVDEEARLFVTTIYPQAYDMKKFLFFPQLTVTVQSP